MADESIAAMSNGGRTVDGLRDGRTEVQVGRTNESHWKNVIETVSPHVFYTSYMAYISPCCLVFPRAASS